MESFEEIVSRCPVALGMKGGGVAEVVSALVGELVASGALDAARRDEAVAAVMERERLGSTAISSGIAIPHGYLDGVQGTAVAIGVHPDGVDCGAPDGEPSRVFVLMLNSSKVATGHIRFLVALNQRLLLSSVRERILAAKERGDVVSALLG